MSERDALNQLAAGSHPDPFSILGAHDVDGVRCATYFAPGAARAAVVDEQGRQIRRARRIHDAG
ncbi:MAG: hypothetical protein AAFQ99_08870, partial [Pseudomonadota bacterium]